MVKKMLSMLMLSALIVTSQVIGGDVAVDDDGDDIAYGDEYHVYGGDDVDETDASDTSADESSDEDIYYDSKERDEKAVKELQEWYEKPNFFEHFSARCSNGVQRAKSLAANHPVITIIGASSVVALISAYVTKWYNDKYKKNVSKTTVALTAGGTTAALAAAGYFYGPACYAYLIAKAVQNNQK